MSSGYSPPHPIHSYEALTVRWFQGHVTHVKIIYTLVTLDNYCYLSYLTTFLRVLSKHVLMMFLFVPCLL